MEGKKEGRRRKLKWNECLKWKTKGNKGRKGGREGEREGGKEGGTNEEEQKKINKRKKRNREIK